VSPSCSPYFLTGVVLSYILVLFPNY